MRSSLTFFRAIELAPIAVVRGPRWYRCPCADNSTPDSLSPLAKLLTTHTAPELEYLESKWAAQMSFDGVVKLLNDVLPIDHHLHAAGIRARVLATAQRLEDELGPEQFAYDGGCKLDIEESPGPEGPVTVGLDGGYVRGRKKHPGSTGQIEVIAGKSIPTDGKEKVFALVQRIDKKPKRRLHDLLRSQGILPRQQVTSLTDGGD